MIMNLEQIKELLPHRYPFLFVDEIIEFEPQKRAVGIKKINSDEFFFQGHFPKRPIMPGVIITEAMAQVGGIIIMQMEVSHNKLAVLVGLDNVRFRGIVVPEDTIIISAELVNLKSKIGKVKAQARVKEKLIAEGEILFSLID